MRKEECSTSNAERSTANDQRRVFVGAWVTEAFAVEVNHAAECRGFTNRSEFVRYVLEFGVNC